MPMKRPISVWLVQILLSLICVVVLPGLLTWTVVTFRSLWESTRPPAEVLLFYGDFLARVGVLGFFGLSVFAIARRWPKSRLMGLGALIIVVALFTYGRLNPTPAGQGLPRMQYDTPAERGGAFVLDVLFFIGLWILFFRFGFSEKARSFFSQQPDSRPDADAQKQRAG
jgi:hypothetical protein